MEQAKYLIDTNVVIDYLSQKLTASGMSFISTIVDEVPNISVITKIELLGFNGAKEHSELLLNFTNDGAILDLTSNTVDICIELRKKNSKIHLPDAIIAATAIVHKLTLLTRNISDFKNIKSLKSINPHSL